MRYVVLLFFAHLLVPFLFLFYFVFVGLRSRIYLVVFSAVYGDFFVMFLVVLLVRFVFLLAVPRALTVFLRVVLFFMQGVFVRSWSWCRSCSSWACCCTSGP